MTTRGSAAGPLLIHVGYPKSASSWLQRRLFASPASNFQLFSTPEETVRNLTLPNSFAFDPKRARSRFDAAIEEAWGNERIPVLSHEFLTGRPDRPPSLARDFADRLAATFPDARVLLALREQRSAAVSWYRELIREGNPFSVRRLFAAPRRGFRPAFDLRYLEYDLLVGYYQRLFGKDRVLAIPMELLAREPAHFVEEVAGFAGARIPDRVDASPVRPGFSGLALAVHRVANRLYRPDPARSLPWHQRLARRICYRLDRIVPAAVQRPLDRRLVSAVHARIGERYRDSNARTSRLIGFDLSRFGYAQPNPPPDDSGAAERSATGE